jgi:hypothetical protein
MADSGHEFFGLILEFDSEQKPKKSRLPDGVTGRKFLFVNHPGRRLPAPRLILAGPAAFVSQPAKWRKSGVGYSGCDTH